MTAQTRWEDRLRHALFRVTMAVLFPLATRTIKFGGKCAKR